MTWADYDIVSSFNAQRYPSIDAERIVNCFEYIDPRSKKPKSLIQTSGLLNTNVLFPNVSAGAFRAQFVFGPTQYAVISDKIYAINSSLVASELAQINTTSGYVGIDANTFQILIVDGQDGWIIDTLANSVVQITDPAFPTRPIDCTYLDGFFVVANGQTNTFQLSEFNQGLIWGTVGTNAVATFAAGGSGNITISGTATNLNFQVGTPVVFSGGGLPAEITAGTTYYVVYTNAPTTTIIRVSATKGGSPITYVAGGNGTIDNNGELQLGSITSHPGTIQACRTLHRRLFLFAENFTEVWENQGAGTNLPFRRTNSALIEYGTKSIASVKASFDMMCFLSNDKDGQGAVMAVFGMQAIPISNRALDFQIAQYAAAGHVSDASGILIKENGLIFYRLNFTQANHTYVYNVSMSDPATEEGKRWHEEETLRGDRHLAQTHAFYNGVNYYGSYLNSIMYQVDPNETTNDGEVIKRTIIGKPVTPPDYKRLRIDRFQLDLLQGQDTTQLFQQAFTANVISDIITVPSTSKYITGDVITVSSSGGILPQPLAAFTDYYVIVLSSTEIRLATTRAHALAGTPYINLTTAGTSPNLIRIELNTNITPVVYLSYSKDGGQSFGNRLTGNMGKSGERSFRTVWRKLGTVPRGQGFVPKIEFYNQVPFVVLGASWVFEQMPE